MKHPRSSSLYAIGAEDVSKKNFGMRRDVEEEHLSLIGAPILHCTTLNEVSDSTTYQVHAVFNPLCQFEESFKGERFINTEHSLQSFVNRIIASMIRKNPASQNDCQEQTIAIEQLEEFVSRVESCHQFFDPNVSRS